MVVGQVDNGRCIVNINNFMEKRDLCIIGVGPAGITAAIYAARYKIDVAVVGELPGGYISSSHLICNYPSENAISGFALTDKMFNRLSELNIPHYLDKVVSIGKTDEGFKVEMSAGNIILAKTVLLAIGTKHRHLGLDKEEEFIGKGISYCATCDGMFYAGKKVAVVGGSDSANTSALYLSKIASEVYQIYRGAALRGETAWIEQVKANPKIKVLYNTQITKLGGVEKLEYIEVNQPINGENKLVVDGLFVEVGSEPKSPLVQQLSLLTDENGYIKVSADQATNEKGVWAAGDATTGSNYFRQIITACSEGAVATNNIFNYLQKSVI